MRTAGGVTGNAGKGKRDSGFVELASLFLKGKILYTPDNNVTRYIVSQVSRSTHVFGVYSLMLLGDLSILEERLNLPRLEKPKLEGI